MDVNVLLTVIYTNHFLLWLSIKNKKVADRIYTFYTCREHRQHLIPKVQGVFGG